MVVMSSTVLWGREVAIIILCFILVAVICTRFACAWCSRFATDCPLVPLLVLGAGGARGRAFTAWSVDMVTCCTGLTGVAVVNVLVFAVVSPAVDVSASVVAGNATGCHGLQGIYGACGYFCWGQFISLYLSVSQHGSYMYLSLVQKGLVYQGDILFMYEPSDVKVFDSIE